jgi:2-keto-4-pentenoate hydratase/2-oxohepta-3-ene-1,7-dioic acid hydratase in catechol pathway
MPADRDKLGCVNLEGSEIADVTAALDVIAPQTWPLRPGDPLIANLSEVCQRVDSLLASSKKKRTGDITLASPLATPSKVIGAPNNYHKHFEEAKADKGIHFGSEVKTIEHSGLFLKASSSLSGPAEGVVLPNLERRMDHEVELALIIGKAGRYIQQEHALDYVAAYTIGLDMTIRGTEDRSWRKSFETFSVLGPWLVTSDEIPDPDDLNFSIKVNGEIRQQSNTSALIYDVRRLIEVASSAYALYPGDVIMTGTPEGVASVQPGDVMECWMEKIGTMRVPVRAAS